MFRLRHQVFWFFWFLFRMAMKSKVLRVQSSKIFVWAILTTQSYLKSQNYSAVWRFAGHTVAGLALPCRDTSALLTFNKPLPSCFKNVALHLTLLLVINNFHNQRVCLIKIRLQILILIGLKCCNIMHKALVKWQFT